MLYSVGIQMKWEVIKSSNITSKIIHLQVFHLIIMASDRQCAFQRMVISFIRAHVDNFCTWFSVVEEIFKTTSEWAQVSQTDSKEWQKIHT